MPDNEELHDQGAMFMGEKGKLYLPHFMKIPKKIIDGKYVDLDLSVVKESDQLGPPTSDYGVESNKHYHQFVDACLGKAETTAPFSYAARLTETILLGVIAGRFPGKTLHWDNSTARFSEEEANVFLEGEYRDF